MLSTMYTQAFAQWKVLSWNPEGGSAYYKIKTKGQDTAFIVGKSRSYSEGVVIKTVDGGSSWTDITPADCVPEYTSIDIAGSNRLCIIGGYEGLSNNRLFSVLMVSEDAGLTWMQGVDFQEMVFDIHCIDENECIVAGNNHIYYSNDLFTHKTVQWSFTDIGIEFGTLHQVDFLDKNTGFACGFYNNSTRGIVLKSTDGGFNWDVLYKPEIYSRFYSLYVLNQDTIFIGGQDCMHVTTNGGDDWERIALLKKGNRNLGFVRSIIFVNDSTGFAVNQNLFGYINEGSIFKTLDYGRNWTIQDTWDGLYSITFLDEYTGYIVGDYSTILMTTNGGGEIVMGVDEFDENRSLDLYPNPTNLAITIRSLVFIPRSSIFIYDIFGRILNEIKVPQGQSQTRIDVSDYPAAGW